MSKTADTKDEICKKLGSKKGFAGTIMDLLYGNGIGKMYTLEDFVDKFASQESDRRLEEYRQKLKDEIMRIESISPGNFLITKAIELVDFVH